MRDHRSDDGQLMVLIIGFVLLALLLATVVIAASSVYIEHKKLLSLADGASVAAADSFTLGQLETVGGSPTAVLTGARVRSTAADFLDRSSAFTRFSGLERRAGNGQPGRLHRRRGAQRRSPPARRQLPGPRRHQDRSEFDGAFPAHALAPT